MYNSTKKIILRMLILQKRRRHLSIRMNATLQHNLMIILSASPKETIDCSKKKKEESLMIIRIKDSTDNHMVSRENIPSPKRPHFYWSMQQIN